MFETQYLYSSDPSADVAKTLLEELTESRAPLRGTIVSDLASKGYQVITITPITAPFEKAGKAPGRFVDGEWKLSAGWNKPIEMTDAVIEALQNDVDRGAGLGILSGLGVLGVDADILHEGLAADFAKAVAEILGDAVPTRIGRPPKALFLVRTDGPVAYRSSPVFEIDGLRSKLEFLGANRGGTALQFVAFGRHPETRAPYRWFNGDPTTLAVNDLPLVTVETMDRLIKAFVFAAEIHGGVEVSKGKVNDDGPRENRGDAETVGPATLRKVLGFIKAPDEYENWMPYAAACKRSLEPHDWPEGAEIFEAWSAKSNNFDNGRGQTARQLWDDFSVDDRKVTRTFKSLAWEARRNGWDGVPDPADFFGKITDEDVAATFRTAGGAGSEGAGPGTGPKPPKFMTLAAARSADTIKPDYLIQDVFERVGTVLLGGLSQAGKTVLALDLARCLASGELWFGNRIRHRGATLYLAAESFGTVAPRVEALHQHHLKDAPPEANGIIWAAFPGKAALGALIDEAKQFALEVMKLELRLVVVDTGAAAFEITDDGQVAPVLWFCNGLAEEKGLTLLLNVHFGKVQERGIKGTVDWTGNVNTVLAAICDKDLLTGKVTNRSLHLSKSKVAPERLLGCYDVIGVPVGHDEDGKEVPVPVAVEVGGSPKRRRQDKQKKLSAKASEVLALVPEIGWISKVDLRAEVYAGFEDLNAKAQGSARRDVDRRIAELKKAGLIEVEEKRVRRTLGFEGGVDGSDDD